MRWWVVTALVLMAAAAVWAGENYGVTSSRTAVPSYVPPVPEASSSNWDELVWDEGDWG